MFFKKKLSTEAIDAAQKKVAAAAEEQGHEAAWEEARPLLNVQRRQLEVAHCLLSLVEEQQFSVGQALEILKQIHSAHAKDVETLCLVGGALQGASDIDDLNAPPPDHELFEGVIGELANLLGKFRDTDSEKLVLTGLASAARVLGRQRDDLAEQCYKRLVEIEPERSSYHYNLGLFYKTRGKHAEGLLANQMARNLEDEPSESVSWNLGICATGAGEGAIALELWQQLGQKIEMGRFGLPEGGYPDCKVKLAERPLAERTSVDDNPGLEETIWIERLSPCHGIVRSVLYQNLGVDYGDLILMDGAPITYHKYGDTDVPVFPHLTTLIRSNYSFYQFAGTQDAAGRIFSASNDLDGDIVVYPHSENYKVLCSSCWKNPDLNHERHVEDEMHVVTGRIAAPESIEPSELLDQLDAVFAAREPCRIYTPELCEAAARVERIEFEKRRFDILSQS